MRIKLLIALLVGGIILAVGLMVIKNSFQPSPSNNTPGSVASSTTVSPASSDNTVASHAPCLGNDEYADYLVNTQYPVYQKAAKVPVVISVRDKIANTAKFSFTIENVPPDESEQLELHRCGIYVLSEFQGSIWSREVWKYDYSGNGKKLFTLLQVKNNEIIKTEPQFYAYFYIDPAEKYIALDAGPLGSDNQATVVKSLASPDLPDVLIVKGQDILKAASTLSPNRSAEPFGWSSDGQYLWGGSSEIDQSHGAYFRINVQNKNSLEVFPMPPDAIHFGPPRPNTGYIVYVYGPTFAGIPEETQQIDNEWIKAGKKETLFLYNLFTKKKVQVAISDNPDWNFSEYWISDNQFQYTLPSGTTSTYTISK